MTVPDYQSLMLPVLKLASLGERRVPEVAELIADQFGILPAERERLLPSGRQRILHNRIHWAKFYLGKAGLVKSPSRGRFIASQNGRDLLSTNPPTLNVQVLKSYPEFAEFYRSGRLDQAGSDDTLGISTDEVTPEEQIDVATGLLNRLLKNDLLDRILLQTPQFFERLVVELLVAMGYGGTHESAALSLGKTGDGGVDGVIDEDRLGLDRIYVQAKRYAVHIGIGRPDVQGFVGSLVGFGATKGVFVTTSSFSDHAIEYVRRLPQRVVLIDGARLTDLMVEHNVGVSTSRTISVKRLDENFFSEE